MNRITTIAALLLACGAARAQTRLAVIPVGNSEAESLADLVQLRLGDRKDLVLLERGAIKEILREQELQGALAADAPGKRAALGKLLRADVLVVLAARDKPEPHVEIVVCETKQGLRLRAQPLKRTENVEADVATLIKVLDPALAKQREDLREIVAVPPLLNNSLTREMDHLQAAYARLIEESLLQRPGVLVVELSEANAIAQEVSLGGTGIGRRLPLYLVGEYRVEGAGDKRRGRFTWKLRRGESELDSRQAADLPVEELPMRLRESAEGVLDKAIGRPRKASDTVAERRQLSERASAFEAIGNWPETLALAEAGLVLDPNNTEFHGRALRALNRMATERNVFERELTYRIGSIPAEDTLRAVQCMRAALPHMEAYLRGTRLDVHKHLWCVEDPWRSLRLWLWVSGEYKTLPGEMDLHQQHRLFAELYSDLMAITNRVLQSKAASRTDDHALCLLFRFTEPPKNADASSQSPRLDAQWNPWPDWDLATVCQHRLRLLDQFSFATDPQNAAAFYAMVSADEWGKWSDPIHEAFLAKMEKLPNRSYSQIIRTTRELRLKIADWKPAARPESTVLHDAEVVFHQIGLRVDGERTPFSGHVFSWIRTCSGVDTLLGDTDRFSRPVTSLFLMKKKGQLIRLPLQCCEPPLHSGIYHNLCWDGRFLWVASPDQTPVQASSEQLSTPGQERFLAVVDPQNEQIMKFTAEDGLPTMKSTPGAKEIGAAAVTALEPGKALVAGYFGRLWCAIASFTPEKGKKLDVFFEAREVPEATSRERQSAKTVASPIGFLCTLAAPPAGGTSGSQRVLLARQGNLAPLLIDPEKRSVEVCSYELNPSEAVLFGMHDGSLYYSKQHSTTGRSPVYRIGFPSFMPELVNPSVPFGPCVVDDGRVYVWHQGEMQMARAFAEPFRALRCAAPVAPFQFAALHGMALSHHYGMVVWRPGDFTWSPMRLYGAEVRSAGSLSASARKDGAKLGAPAFTPHTTIKLSARVSHDDNKGDFIYTWRVTSGADVVFTDNGTKSAKDTTAILQHAGTYSFAVSITDAHGKPVPGRAVMVKAWMDPAPIPNDRGDIGGQVVDPAGKPVAGATVWFRRVPQDEDSKTPEKGTTEKTTTDAQGRFVFSETASTFDPRKPQRREVLVRDSQGRLGGEGGVFGAVIAPGQNLRIKVAGVEDCRGRLVDTAGQPIVRARISPRRIADGGLDDSKHGPLALPPELTKELECESGPDGAFTLRQMPAGGSVGCTITASGFGSPMVAWNLTGPVTFRLERVGSVRGALLAGPGATGLDALKLRLYPKNVAAKMKTPGPRGSYSAATLPDREGVFRFEDVPPGSYTIQPAIYASDLPYYVAGEMSCEVRPGQTASVEVKLMPAVTVRGQVIDSQGGRGIAGVEVWAHKVSGNLHLGQRKATTDGEGRFRLYVEPGKVELSIENPPDGYLTPFIRTQPQTTMDVPHDVVWPPIKLMRAVRLEGFVVDESGKPVPAAQVQVLWQFGGPRFGGDTYLTDAHGKFSVGGLHPQISVVLRVRTETAVSTVMRLSPANAAGPILVVLSPAKVFAIRGVCVDSAGRPVPQARVEVASSGMFRVGDMGSDITNVETDAEGRFEVRPLWPGLSYSFRIRAEGYDVVESKSIQAEPGQIHDAGRMALQSIGGFVEGIVTNSAGEPIAGVRVFNSGDAPRLLTTQTDAVGRFRLDGFRVGPVYVFAEKEGYRFTGVDTQTGRTGERIQLLRSGEPVPAWKPQRQPPSFAEEQKVVRRLLEKLRATRRGRDTSIIRIMARIDRQQARKWCDEPGGDYTWREIVFERGSDSEVDEMVKSLIEQDDMSGFYLLKTLAGRYAPSQPEKALRFAKEALLRGRKGIPGNPPLPPTDAAVLLARIGKVEGGRQFAEELADIVESGVTDQSPAQKRRAVSDTEFARIMAPYQSQMRCAVAAALAPYDLPRALKLLEKVPDRDAHERGMARIAVAIAPGDLAKALEMIGRLEKRNEYANRARAQIAYGLAPSRPDDAIRVVEGMEGSLAVTYKADAYAWLAEAVSPRDPRLAHTLIDRSMAMFSSPDTFLWVSHGGRSTAAARIAAQAKLVGYPDMELLVNRVLATRPVGAESNAERARTLIRTAKLLALTDPGAARQILLAVAPLEPTRHGLPTSTDHRDLLCAWMFADLDRAAKAMDFLVDDGQGNTLLATFNSLSILDLLATPPRDRLCAILRQSGWYWVPGWEL